MSMVKEELISTLAAPVSVHSVSKYASTLTCKRKHDRAFFRSLLSLADFN